MKIYIITRGCYSDYGIEKVFTDKEKAELYAKLKTTSGYGGECNVEEYDTADDYEPEHEYYNLVCSAKINKNSKGIYELLYIDTDVYINDTSADENTYVFEAKKWDRHCNFDIELLLQRAYDAANITSEQASKKIEKIAEDISTQICYEMNCNGATFKDIESIIYNKDKKKTEENK